MFGRKKSKTKPLKAHKPAAKKATHHKAAAPSEEIEEIPAEDVHEDDGAEAGNLQPPTQADSAPARVPGRKWKHTSSSSAGV